MQKAPLIKIGWRELIALPELNVTRLHAKIDTGARSSAIHAEKISPFSKDGNPWISFEVNTDDDTDLLQQCEMPVSDQRYVMNSGGKRELRYFVRTILCIANHSWPIDLSLTTRNKLKYSMLIGREALGKRVIIAPGHRYLTGEPKPESNKKASI